MQKWAMCFIIGLVVSSFAWGKSSTQIDLPRGLKLMPVTQHSVAAQSHYKLDVDSPQIDGIELTPAAKKFDQDINNIINNTIADFKRHVTENSAAAKNLPESVRDNSLEIDYTAYAFNAEGQQIVSVRINNEIYYAGAAHPMNSIQVYNFNLTQGKEIRLSDLFKTDSGYLKVFSSYARTELANKIKIDDEKTFNEGTDPTADNYDNWNLQPDGVLITFNEYQVAPYSYGQPEVVIPYALLQDEMINDAAIAVCPKKALACQPY